MMSPNEVLDWRIGRLREAVAAMREGVADLRDGITRVRADGIDPGTDVRLTPEQVHACAVDMGVAQRAMEGAVDAILTHVESLEATRAT